MTQRTPRIGLACLARQQAKSRALGKSSAQLRRRMTEVAGQHHLEDLDGLPNEGRIAVETLQNLAARHERVRHRGMRGLRHAAEYILRG
ncbi:MAG: hypothetical protein IPI67_37235 [Myxococcales bacterium]|nr:hypothetical protein [Myxococcales bacterium]